MKHLKPLTAITAAFLLFTGCNRNTTQPDAFDAKDGTAGFAAAEVSDMSQTAQLMMNGGALSRDAADTVTVVVNRFAKDASSGAWVRSATATYASGTRTRVDSVFFFDASGSIIDTPRTGIVDSVYHIRNITSSRNGNTHTNLLRMNVKKGSDENGVFLVKNGTITGTWNGEELRNVTVNNIKRYIINSAKTFPVSGSIHIDRVLRTIDIEFTGNGNAIATITRKRDNSQRFVQINVTTGEGTESDGN